MKSFAQKLLLTFGFLGGVAGASEEVHKLSTDAPVIWQPELFGVTIPISNSLIMLTLAVIVLTIILRLATRKMSRIPGGMQNFVEWIFETLYSFVEGLIGKHLAKRYFWYFATIFLLILLSNYMGLIPGVGEITYGGKPLFRGANADLNVTLFLGLFYTVLWFVWSIREQGFKHFILHIFGPKGGLKGMLKNLLLPVFFFVGLIELLSIAIRPVALAARLFGNIFAGEAILEQMSNVCATTVLNALAMLPFMCLEILVGFVQALVFLMLTAIFLKTQVGDGHEEEHAA